MTMDCCESLTSPATSRRALLLGGASFAAWAYLPKFARAADGPDPRLIVVILRGALDGLATVAPVGDPDYAGLHGSIALTAEGPHAATMLDSFFALHPAMPEFARMYREKHAAIIHAVATSYRDRSHFDGQDVLESGFAGPGRVQSGWLNRALEGSAPRRWCCAARRRPSAGRRSRCRKPTTIPRCASSNFTIIAIPRWHRRCRRACNSTRPRKATT
jgi:uncharacterized protein (DUF1501 family)